MIMNIMHTIASGLGLCCSEEETITIIIIHLNVHSPEYKVIANDATLLLTLHSINYILDKLEFGDDGKKMNFFLIKDEK